MKKKIHYVLSLCLVIIYTNSMIFGQDVQQTVDTKKTKSSTAEQDSEDEKIWLNLHNDEGAFSQILIGFIDGATNQLDRDYDGKRFFGSNPVAFYSICDGEELAVQGREPREDFESIPLGIQCTVAEKVNLQITIDEMQGYLNGEETEILLEDTLLNITHNLKESSYTFELVEQGSCDDRFQLIVQEAGVLDIAIFEPNNNLILENNQNYMNVKTADNNNILSFNIYDYQGRTITSVKPNSNQFIINSSSLKKGTILLIRAELENNQSISKKLILLN